MNKALTEGAQISGFSQTQAPSASWAGLSLSPDHGKGDDLSVPLTPSTDPSTRARKRQPLPHCRRTPSTDLWSPGSGERQRRRWYLVLRPWHSGRVVGHLGSEAS